MQQTVHQAVSVGMYTFKMILDVVTVLSTRNHLEVKGDRRVKLTSPPSMNQLSRKHRILDVSHPYSLYGPLQE
jgi:hypothetical protein